MPRTPFAFAVLVALLGGPSRAARADYDETERRLKAIGVDDLLRERIHLAIDRSVSWLVERQRTDGSWHDRGAWGSGRQPQVDHTLLAALAVRHAGTPRARTSAERAIRFLFDREELPDDTVTYVYGAGLASMLLAADESHREAHATIAKGLASAFDRSTGWFG